MSKKKRKNYLNYCQKKLIEEICYSKKGVQLVRSLVIFIHYVATRQFDFAVCACRNSWQYLGDLLLLFVGLTTHIIRLEWIYFGSSLLIRYMAVLFCSC